MALSESLLLSEKESRAGSVTAHNLICLPGSEGVLKHWCCAGRSPGVPRLEWGRPALAGWPGQDEDWEYKPVCASCRGADGDWEL